MDHTREVVSLSTQQTQLGPMTPEQRLEALRLAMRLTMSPHEHTWTNSEGAMMAQFVLWAWQRLDAVTQVATADALAHPCDGSNQPCGGLHCDGVSCKPQGSEI